MIKEIKNILNHGIQYVPDLRKVELTPLFRGRPVISPDISPEESLKMANICPTGAITASEFSLDLGKCVFCKECAFACPGKVTFTNDYRMAATSREDLIIKAGRSQIITDKGKIRPEIPGIFKNSLKLRQVSAGGDNSCEMELNASGNVNFDMGRYGIEFVASPRHADGIVITGPISENMSEALKICYDAVPHPKIIVLVGTDAISGGIFQDSPGIHREFLDLYPVDLYVPGNPAHPLTFINGILDLIGK